MFQRIAVVGATSAIATATLRCLLNEEVKYLALIGRRAGGLERLKLDLAVRHPDVSIETRTVRFDDPEEIDGLVNVLTRLPVDLVLIAHGSLPDQGECQRNLTLTREVLELNGVSVVLFAEAFASRMESARQGTLVVIGSVAGDRGRKSNYVYGSAKALVETYLEGLRHRLFKSGVRVVLIKPGPTDTPMTAHLKGRGLTLAPLDQVSQGLVRAIAVRQSIAYVPRRWGIIMKVIRALPEWVFNRTNL